MSTASSNEGYERHTVHLDDDLFDDSDKDPDYEFEEHDDSNSYNSINSSDEDVQSNYVEAPDSRAKRSKPKKFTGPMDKFFKIKSKTISRKRKPSLPSGNELYKY